MRSKPTKGNALVYFKVRDPEARALMHSRLINLMAVEVAPSLFELEELDWADDFWQHELAMMQDLLNPTTDKLIFWHVIDGELVRTSIAGHSE